MRQRSLVIAVNAGQDKFGCAIDSVLRLRLALRRESDTPCGNHAGTKHRHLNHSIGQIRDGGSNAAAAQCDQAVMLATGHGGTYKCTTSRPRSPFSCSVALLVISATLALSVCR